MQIRPVKAKFMQTNPLLLIAKIVNLIALYTLKIVDGKLKEMEG